MTTATAEKEPERLPAGTAGVPSRKTAWQRIWSDKLARLAFIVLGCLYAGAAFADLLAPYAMNYSDPDLGSSPPTKIYILDEKGQPAAPFVLACRRRFNPETFKQDFIEVPGKHYPIKFLVRDVNPNSSAIHLFGVEPPARIFLLGSDLNGRDNFSRLFFGAQKSLTIGFLGLFIAFPIGLIYGGTSGFFGGAVDNLMMRFAEAIMSIPSFYLLIALAAILPAGMSSSQRFALVTVILSVIGWAPLARVIRGMVLTISGEEFVQAAQAAGMPEIINIIVHVLPQTASFVIVAATLEVPYFILSESSLSFIGLGIQQPDASWGNMLKSALDNVNDLLSQPWLLAPGLLIFITILCFNTLGDVLRDVLDPKMQGRS